MFNQNDYQSCIFCLDDITASINRQRDREAQGGISPIADCLTLGRELQIKFILVTHSITEMSDICRQTAGLYFVCGIRGENSWLMRNTLGITQEQYEAFINTRPGQAICLNNLLYEKPILFEFDLPNIPGQCDEAMRQLDLEPFLSKLIITPPVPLSTFLPNISPENATDDSQSNESMPELPNRGFEFMVQVASNLPTGISKIYQRMGLSTTQGRRISKRLEELGYIQIHRFSTGKVGGRVSLVMLTEPAWKLLKQVGTSPAKSRTNGGWEHEVAAVLLEAEGKKQGYVVSFEVDLGSVRIDVQWLDRKTGKRWLFNIGISNPEHEVDNIEKFLQLPAAHDSSFTLVARDTSFAKKVRDILNKRNLAATVGGKFQTKLITDYLSF